MTDYDVVVYGGTLAGIMAATRAQRRGLRVCLLEPTGYLGGHIAGGLVMSDIPLTRSALAGLTNDLFFRGIGAQYGSTEPKYDFEAFAAQRVADELAERACARIVRHARLSRPDMDVLGDRIRGVRVAGEWIRARFFIDASYDGDLMAFAGVPYTIGREPAAKYGEPTAGFVPDRAFVAPGVTVDSGFPLLPPPDSAPGDGDDKVQSYNFRCIVTRDQNRIPFHKPDGYDPRMFEIVRQVIEIDGAKTFMDVVQNQAELPNGKVQTNNGLKTISCDLPNQSWDYPDGDWQTRDDVIRRHALWQLGLFHWLANDPAVPPYLRADAASWGLPADEFTDSPFGAGWPHALYIREGRRMLGAYVFTERDQTAPHHTKATSVCQWRYPRDCHGVQLYVSDGALYCEGPVSKIWIDPDHPVDTHQIPAEVLFPATGGISNIAVPVCFSVSHVGYMTTRLEPAFGMLGEACGELAALSIKNDQPVQRYDYAELAANLTEFGTVL